MRMNNMIFSITMKSILLLLVTGFTSNAMADSYIVKPGDNMWKIASTYTQGKVTTHQMIAAIHEMNSSQLGNDLDNIHAGMKLEIPSIEMASGADSSKATSLLARNSEGASVNKAQAEAILHKINNIEKEINQVMSDIESTKMTFEKSLND